MDISMTPQMESIVRDKINSGLYRSADDVIEKALSLLDQRDRRRRGKLEELRRKIDEGIQQLERGEFEEYDEESLGRLFEEIKEKGRAHLLNREQRA